jgi:bacillolysin
MRLPAHRLTTLSLVMALCLALAGLAVPAIAATDPTSSGHLNLTGDAAAAFVLPRDVTAVSSWTDAAHGLKYTRYQQFARPFGVHVDGAQLTVVKRGGRQVLVIGSHHAGLRVIALPAIKAAAARMIAAAGVENLVTQRSELRFDPASGRLFHLVESGGPGVALFHQVDAQTGVVIDSWNAIEGVAGDGTGVKGDTKHLAAGPMPGFGSLTSGSPGNYKMQSQDGRFETYTANGGTSVGLLVADTDNDWSSASQRAAVDAQYYAALTAAFYESRFDFDLFSVLCNDPVFADGIRSVVHYDPRPNDGKGYANAFWHPFEHFMVYGDGNSQYAAMSGAQDVVTHELTHAVTQCRGDLTYQDEPGALNEAFSDIMAASAEWDFEEGPPASAHCWLAPGQGECADWLLGEDTISDPAGTPFRDFADPQSFQQPSHYADRIYIGQSYDDGGVHFNSGIANHAFYLLVNGGRNARCSGPTDPQADCDVVVPGIGLEAAEQIFFSGFGMLESNASFCDAREKTLAAATAPLYDGPVTDLAAVDLAWAAVGRDGTDCPPLPSDFSISIASPALVAAPGDSVELAVNLTWGTESGPIDFQVEHAGPVSSATFAPPQSVNTDNNTQLSIDVEANAADGVYPVLIKATGASDTHYASAALVIDSAAPEVDVARARFVTGSTPTVGVNGTVKLNILWSATDDGSGVATARLDHSPNGSAWSPIFGPGVPTGNTDYTTTAGAHHFRLIGTDALGNSATSAPPLATTLFALHENSGAITYTKVWTQSGISNTWGGTRFVKKSGASAKLVFNGTDVIWVAQKGPKRGNAYVYIDGVRSSVSLFASSLQERRIVFAASNLTPGVHTIRIVCRGTNNRPRIDIDGLFYLNQ